MKSKVYAVLASLLAVSAFQAVKAERLPTPFELAKQALLATKPAPAPLWQELAKLAPTADAAVLRMAVDAMTCAVKTGQQNAERLAVIDFAKPSTEIRLWVFDLASKQLLFSELVAHGRNSGANYANAFSDRTGSHASSLGLYRTLSPYMGKHGYSLRLAGLEPGYNANALSRAIVIHGADYVSDTFAKQQGRLGRSHGCPAVRTAVATSIVDSLKGGNYVFAYYPDAQWLKTSRFLACDGPKTFVAEGGGTTPATDSAHVAEAR